MLTIPTCVVYDIVLPTLYIYISSTYPLRHQWHHGTPPGRVQRSLPGRPLPRTHGVCVEPWGDPWTQLKWSMYGSCMIYVWSKYDLCMGKIWKYRTYRTWMGNQWNTHMRNRWTNNVEIHGKDMALFGMSMENIRVIYWKYMGVNHDTWFFHRVNDGTIGLRIRNKPWSGDIWWFPALDPLDPGIDLYMEYNISLFISLFTSIFIPLLISH